MSLEVIFYNYFFLYYICRCYAVGIIHRRHIGADGACATAQRDVLKRERAVTAASLVGASVEQ